MAPTTDPVTIVYLPFDTFVPFRLVDPSYGRNLFDLCVRWHRGAARQVIVRPDLDLRLYEFRLDLGSYGPVKEVHYGTYGIPYDHAMRIWREGWCRDHKAVMKQIYPPDGIGYFRFSRHFGDCITFEFWNAPMEGAPVWERPQA